MTIEKYKTVVKRQHVRHREILVLVGAVLIGLVLFLGFFLGQRAAYSGMGVDPDLYREMELSIPLTKQELLYTVEELDRLQVQNELDRAALEIVRKEMVGQQDQIENLEEGVRFYKSLMAPEEIAQGLSLRKPELVAAEQAGHFIFRLVAQQEARKHATLKGSLFIEIVGELEGAPKSYTLAELSDDIDEPSIALRFRYFQAIEGELVIPKGFQPLGIDMLAKASSPHKLEFQKHFSWDVRERFAYVGK